jgi:single-stranded-DNA-specific exonuclease
MGDPLDAFRLLITADDVEAARLAKHLNLINDERKGVVAAMIKEIKHAVAERYQSEKRVIVIGNPNWRPAFLGLAAGMVAEEYSCPVFLWGRDEAMAIKGSYRAGGAGESVNVLELMQKVPAEIFTEFGGHSAAGGFTVPHEKIHLLPELLERAFEAAPRAEAAENADEVMADALLFPSDVNWKTWEQLESFQPFGVGNPKPLFLFDKTTVSKIRRFGKEKQHLGIDFAAENGGVVSAISFFTAPNFWGRELEAGGKVTLVASLEKSLFRGYPELRLRIVDLM